MRYGASAFAREEIKALLEKTQTMSKTLYLPEHVAQKMKAEKGGCRSRLLSLTARMYPPMKGF